MSEQQDMDHAVALWRHSASASTNSGYQSLAAAAAGNLAVVFLHGHGVTSDVLLAADWYSAALDQNAAPGPVGAPSASIKEGSKC